MTSKIFFSILILAPTLAACDQPQAAREDVIPKRTEQRAIATVPDAEVNSIQRDFKSSDAGVFDTVVPDLAPPELTPDAERSIKGARNILLLFASEIERKRYGQAWAFLGPVDKQKWSKAAFAAIFADLGKITVSIPDGATEGGAGSIYYTAPISITANDKDGRPVRLEGQAVLRRVNGVDGATRTQLRWHFETLTLDWVH